MKVFPIAIGTIQIGVSGYFLAEEIVSYFEVKKCSETLSGAVVGSPNRFLTAKSGLNLARLVKNQQELQGCNAKP